jgi:hypothetical protein
MRLLFESWQYITNNAGCTRGGDELTNDKRGATPIEKRPQRVDVSRRVELKYLEARRNRRVFAGHDLDQP